MHKKIQPSVQTLTAQAKNEKFNYESVSNQLPICGEEDSVNV